MKTLWIKKPKSFKSAQQSDIDYYLSMSPSERLGTVQYLRETLYKLKKNYGKNRKGLRRIIKVIQ